MPVYQLTDGLVWQRGNHRVRFGFDWEHATSSGQFINQEPATIQLYSPRQVQHFNATAPPALRSSLPSAELLGVDESTFEPGQQVGNYRIVRQIGSGGRG